MLPDRPAARVGLVIFGALWALVVGVEVARAEPAPSPALLRDALDAARRALRDGPAPAPRRAAPADGPACHAALGAEDGDEIPERLEVERVLASCSRSSSRSDPWAVLELLRIEAQVGAPRGLLVAAACWESGFVPGARGDWHPRFGWRAHGFLQMHGWWLAWCGLTPGARDSAEAARCYWRRIDQVSRRREVAVCAEPIVVAEALAANGVKYGPWGCAARSRHADELARWTREETAR